MARSTGHGEIWWVDVEKRRPVVVASRDDRRGVREQTTVAYVSRTIRGIPSEVAVDESDGLSAPSVINCDVLVTVNKDFLVRRIGRLSDRRLRAFHQALRFALAIPRGE